jgi:cation diffusion facilitator CzcD-associated flavoprotein CzcO
MKVCIIGAGSSGIASAKVLHQKGIDFDCFEKGSKIGGNWLYNNDNGMSSAYKSLHINTSKQMMAYSDFPMPDDYPDYPHHSLIYEYFENYVDHFGFRHKIAFNTEVQHVEKLPNGHYAVTTDQFGTRAYDALMVANGHHWSPRYPEFKGEFSGDIIHSHYYKTFDGYEDQRVLIVGIGNSAVDIACELTNVSKRVAISTRSGAYIVPKYLFGIPTDHISKPPLAYAPLAVQRATLLGAILINVGKQDNYGIPTPNRPILREHPTISQELPGKVGHGKITIKPNIKELNGYEVIFEDGSLEEFDKIIYATGYKINFPFFEPTFLEARNNEIDLYHKVVHPEHQNLFFIGLVQPLGAIMPLAEVQSEWVAKLLQGKCVLPDKRKMLRSIQLDRDEMRARYNRSSRHTIQVDFYPYKRLIETEMQQMKVRKGVFA